MRAIDYLNQVKQLNNQINRKMRTAAHWREMAFSITNTAYGEKHNPNRATSAPYEKCILKADALEQEVNADIDRLADLKMEVVNKIGYIEDADTRDILELRYVELLPWDEVESATTGIRSTMFRKHKHGLSELDSILKNET